MKKSQILARLEAAGVVAVVRENNTASALEAAKAVVAGGIHGLEVTFSVPNADQVIAKLKEIYQADQAVVVGAGTVLDAVTGPLGWRLWLERNLSSALVLIKQRSNYATYTKFPIFPAV